MQTCMSVRSTVHEANWKPQFLEWLTYFKSIVVTIVVFERKKKTI
jgi:hypothetical protein